ncbi:MAG: glycerol-3-phosphate 1-O-acyltransferase PlsY [Oscillospiraceae bacterium]
MEWTLSVVICLVASILIGYLLGSLNFAIIITKLFAHDDIRKHGSGNAGLTNVLRTLGKGPASLTLLGDFSKGIVSVLIARLLFWLLTGSSDVILGDYFAVYGALLGHVFPLYYGFKGGKGILVSFGALMILSPIAALICFSGFLLCVIFTRYVSLGSVVAGAIFPFSIILMNYLNSGSITYEVFLTLPITGLIIYMHRTNIIRLLSHTESKLSFSKKEK